MLTHKILFYCPPSIAFVLMKFLGCQKITSRSRKDGHTQDSYSRLQYGFLSFLVCEFCLQKLWRYHTQGVKNAAALYSKGFCLTKRKFAPFNSFPVDLHVLPQLLKSILLLVLSTRYIAKLVSEKIRYFILIFPSFLSSSCRPWTALSLVSSVPVFSSWSVLGVQDGNITFSCLLFCRARFFSSPHHGFSESRPHMCSGISHIWWNSLIHLHIFSEFISVRKEFRAC